MDERTSASPPARPTRTADRHIGGRSPRVYSGDPGVAIELAKAIARGDPASVSRLELGAHTGTRVDAPRHFIPDGEAASELALDAFIGPCVVAQTNASEQLGRTAINSLDLPSGTERILLKTSNSELWERELFVPDFVRLNGD